jgi:hypothetical protein
MVQHSCTRGEASRSGEVYGAWVAVRLLGDKEAGAISEEKAVLQTLDHFASISSQISPRDTTPGGSEGSRAGSGKPNQSSTGGAVDPSSRPSPGSNKPGSKRTAAAGLPGRNAKRSALPAPATAASEDREMTERTALGQTLYDEASGGFCLPGLDILSYSLDSHRVCRNDDHIWDI